MSVSDKLAPKAPRNDHTPAQDLALRLLALKGIDPKTVYRDDVEIDLSGHSPKLAWRGFVVITDEELKSVL